ncbi:MAG: J domain-containing protein [Nitrososphaerota archaeon]|nr:J domain-containing protein [Nitrososphaerota archaeon]
MGVSETASESEVKSAYRHKCTLWHPDKFTPEQRNDPKFSKMVNEEMSRINNAYEKIKQRKGWK